MPAEEPTGQFGRFTRRETLRSAAGAGAALLIPGLLGSTASSALAAASTKPKRGGALIVGLSDGGASDVLAPWNTPYYSAAARAEQVYERLFTYGTNGLPIPALAVSAESNKTGTVWNVKLRSGVTFHNGKPLTAEDVLYSFRYVANPKNNAESLARLAPIDLKTSKALSPTEIQFNLVRPIGDFEGMVSEKDLWIVPDGTTNFDPPIGTGPYKYKSSEIGVRYLYERNPHYWQIGPGGGPPWLDSVEIQIIPDPTARLNALLGGQIQEMTFIDFVSAKANESNSALQLIRTAQPNTTPLYMQIDAPAFRDNRVRTAMKLAMDRQQMVNTILLGYGTIGNDLFGKGQQSYNSSIPQRAHDPEQAISLLKQAKVSHLKLTLPTADAAPGMVQSAVEFVQQAKAVGITVTLNKIDAGTYFSNNLYLKVPFYQTQWAQGFESQALDATVADSPYNETHWYNKPWTAQFYKAEGILDPGKRNAAFKTLQEALWQEGGYMIWGVYDTLDATAPNVRGIVPNPSNGFQNLGGFDFKYHWFA